MGVPSTTLDASYLTPETDPGTGLCIVKGVEIFSTGRHQKVEWTHKKLQQAVSNFHEYQLPGKVDKTPPVVLGHSEAQKLMHESGFPRVGSPTAMSYREVPCRLCNATGKAPEGVEAFDEHGSCPVCLGTKVQGIVDADLGQMPRTIARLVKGRAYSGVSAEVMEDRPPQVPGEGASFRRITLQGDRLPHIKTLADLPADYESMAEVITPDVILRPLWCVQESGGAWECFSEVATVESFTEHKPKGPGGGQFTTSNAATAHQASAKAHDASVQADESGSYEHHKRAYHLHKKAAFEHEKVADETGDTAVKAGMRAGKGQSANPEEHEAVSKRLYAEMDVHKEHAAKHHDHAEAHKKKAKTVKAESFSEEDFTEGEPMEEFAEGKPGPDWAKKLLAYGHKASTLEKMDEDAGKEMAEMHDKLAAPKYEHGDRSDDDWQAHEPRAEAVEKYNEMCSEKMGHYKSRGKRLFGEEHFAEAIMAEMFSEADKRAIVAAVVAQIKADVDPLKRDVAEFKTATRESTKRARVEAFAEQMKVAGKISPHEQDETARVANPRFRTLTERLMAMDDSAVVERFSEGGKEVTLTQLGMEMEAIKARPAQHYGSKTRGSADSGGPDMDLAKVKLHYAAHAEKFSEYNTSEEEFVGGFIANRKYDKTITAEQYLNPVAGRR